MKLSAKSSILTLSLSLCLVANLNASEETVTSTVAASETVSDEVVKSESKVDSVSEASEVVSFNDSNLEQAVVDYLNSMGSTVTVGNVTEEDMQSLTSLYVTSADVVDLTGLESATNLNSLTLDNNQISDVAPLSGLTNLQTLRLNNNQISDIKPLSSLTNLSTLQLNSNQISDISALASFEMPSLSNVGLENQMINTDVVTMSETGEANYDVVDIEGSEFTVSLGTPIAGEKEMSGDFEIPTSIGTSGLEATFSGTVTHVITINASDDTASITEEKRFSDEGLVNLFQIESSVGGVITTEKNTVDYSTPGEYAVTFTDDYTNEFVGIVTVLDVVPVLVVEEDSITVPVGSSISDVIDSLTVRAMEISEGDLNDVIEYDDSDVDYDTPGTYQLVISIVDEEGNVISRTVDVVVEAVQSEVIAKVETSDVTSEVEGDVTLATTGSVNALVLIAGLISIIGLTNIKRLTNK